jgi:hypothetical protein
MKNKQEELTDLEARIGERKAKLIALNDSLIAALAPFYGYLQAEYSKQAAPLEARQAEIRGSVNTRHDEARREVLARKLTEAVAAGDTAAIEEREAGLAALDDEARSRDSDLADIAKQLETIAVTVFDHATLEARQQIHAALSECLDKVHDIKAGLSAFAQEHGLECGPLTLSRLTKVSSIGSEGPLKALLMGLVG